MTGLSNFSAVASAAANPDTRACRSNANAGQTRRPAKPIERTSGSLHATASPRVSRIFDEAMAGASRRLAGSGPVSVDSPPVSSAASFESAAGRSDLAGENALFNDEDQAFAFDTLIAARSRRGATEIEILAGSPRSTAMADAHGVPLSHKARAYLAAMAETGVLVSGGLGIAANFADYVAPFVVEGVADPTARRILAAGFSGVFLGMSGPVFAAAGKDLAGFISQTRQAPVPQENSPGILAKLGGAVCHQTVPVSAGLGAGFALAAALDAGAGDLTSPNITAERFLLKLGRAALSGILVGLAQEGTRHASAGFQFDQRDRQTAFQNMGQLGRACASAFTDCGASVPAYFRPDKDGKAAAANVLGAALGFMAFAAILQATASGLETLGDNDPLRTLAEPKAAAAVSNVAGIVAYVIADQLVRNTYAAVVSNVSEGSH